MTVILQMVSTAKRDQVVSPRPHKIWAVAQSWV